MKTKLVVNKKELKPTQVAAHFAGVKVGDSPLVLGDEVTLEVDFKSPSDLFRMGKLSTQVTGSELEQIAAKKAEKASK